MASTDTGGYKPKRDAGRWKNRKPHVPQYDRKKSTTAPGSSSPNESSRSPSHMHPSSESSDPKSTTETTKISNGSLLIPSMPERLSAESQMVLDLLTKEYPAITGTQAWVPIIDISSSPSAPSAGSFFGGHKILTKEGTEWPVCLTCKAPLVVVAQIDRGTLPHALGGKGLVQVFACSTCAKNKSDIKPKSACWANVVYPKETDLVPKECPLMAAPLRRIVKWLPRQDFMHPEDIEKTFEHQLTSSQWAVMGEVQIRSDKIGGYPCWLDKDSRGKIGCKICKANMRLLAQIDSCDNVPIEWGNDGCILVFECQHHADVVSAVMMSNSDI